MMISGISASEEMCLTAADGTHLVDISAGCLAIACMQAMLTLTEQMRFWNRVQLLLQRGMAGSSGSSKSWVFTARVMRCFATVRPCKV